MSSSVFLTTVTAVLSVVNCVFAAPVTTITSAPTRATRVPRQAITEFGTEVITATVNNAVATYTLHPQVNLANTGLEGRDELFVLSPALVNSLLKLYADISVSPVSAPQPVPRSEDLVLRKRVDPPVITELRPDEVTNAFLGRIFDALGPGQEFEGVVAAVNGNGLRNIGGENTPNAQELRELVLFWNAQQRARPRNPLLQNIHRFVATINEVILIVLSIQIQIAAMQADQQFQFIIANALFNNNPVRTTTCETGPDAPACVDEDCQGEDGLCTIPEKSGCKCLKLYYMVPGYPYDESRIDAQQQVLARLAPVSLDSTNPRCGGIGTQTWIPRDEGASAIEWFCDKYREGGTISGNPGEEWATKVQKSTMINIGIVFRESFSIPPSQCKALFYKVLDGCDGNEIDNPGNWKHGGSIVHPKGATLVFAPEKQPVPFCNDQGSPAGSAHWVDYGVGEKAVQSFCDRLFFPLRGSAGNRFQQTFGQGTSEQITLSMAFTEDFSLSMSDCVDGMRSPLLTCHRNDPLNNPDDNQYGGIFISDAGVIFRVTPDVTPPVYPPDAVTPDGVVISPNCWPDVNYSPGSAGFEESINAFCVEGNPFSTRQTTYTFQLTDAETMKVNLFLTAKDVDVPRTYKQGPTVCRAHGPWKGKIIEQECKFAFHAMRDKCIANFEDADKFHPTTFVHNCVDYSFRTDLGQNSQAKVVAGAAIESGSSLGSPTTSINATGVFWSGATTGTAGPRPFLRRNAHKNNTGNLSYRYT